MSDRELVKLILKGDQEALRMLILRYQDLVMNTCYRILDNRSDAEDITQEVFLQAYKSMPRLRQEETISYWLYRISLNKSINLSKRKKLFRAFSVLDNDNDSGLPGNIHRESPDLSDNPHDLLEYNERLELINEALKTLPARQRKAFVLHYYEHLSYKDIGKILNASVPSVESLIFRAKEKIKKLCLKRINKEILI